MKNKILSRRELFSTIHGKIEKYRKRSRKAQELIKQGKDYTGKNKNVFPLSELESGPVTEDSLVPWSIFAAIISRKDIQKIIKEKKKTVSFTKRRIKVKHLLNNLFPVKEKQQHKKR